jgi:hypothetical protein
VDRAQSILRDGGNFSTGREAGVSLARVASLLRADTVACGRDHLRTDHRCQARSAAFGYAQVVAVAVLGCTAPGRLEARTATLRYLVAVERVGPTGTIPQPPPPPSCG